MKRLTVALREDEREALELLSVRERRQLREQAAVLIRNGLKLEGMLLGSSYLTSEQYPDEDNDGA
jgi:hypothetical protein